jgi:acyl-CoA synthetase (AMP-forming)/AMP-acid ligase II/alkylation response protein AidB-like acyl-CoA dehydrogenase/acyl carrier protein
LFNESSGREANTFTDILVSRAQTHADRRAYVFLRDGEDEEATLTFGELHRRALAVANRLRSSVSVGERAILLYPAGLEFAIAFFGCLYAGVVPIPVSLPNRQRGTSVLSGIAKDSGAKLLLSTVAQLAHLGDDVVNDRALSALSCASTENWGEADHVSSPSRFGGDHLALLQYTSGSTGVPRGVAVTHRNLLDNQRNIQSGFGNTSESLIVSWLPMFHDMGLGGALLQAVWLGVPCVLMSPTAFLQKPVRWLRAISRYRGTFSGAPDFAYDLCARRVEGKQCEDLDLSSWAAAYNGSEPVRALTVERFTKAFARYGFDPRAVRPAYGLAEATLLVTTPNPGDKPMVRRFQAEGLERGAALPIDSGENRALVGCGKTSGDTRVTIVDPVTREKCGPGRVGEIWISGSSVAGGYWGREEETRATFRAETSDGDGPYLRTGDLGFNDGGQLFITGRSKDLIIIRGLNHYPQDIEASVSSCHPSLEADRCAAFALEGEEGETLVVVQEVKREALRRLNAPEVIRAIRSAVAERHGLNTHAIVLIRPATLPRTTSGKVRRKACLEAFVDDTLPVVARSALGNEPLQSSPDSAPGDVQDLVNATPDAWPPPSKPPSSSRQGDTSLPSLPATKVAENLITWLRMYASSAETEPNEALRQLEPALIRDFAKQGLLGMQVPAQYGGLGLRHAETARVIEQLAAIDLNAGLFVALNTYLGIAPIARYGSSRLKDSLLPRLVGGEDLAGFAFAEPGNGSNPDALTSYAEQMNGSGWKLYGDKYASGGTSGVGFFNVFVRHRDRAGVTAFVVPQRTTGLRLEYNALSRNVQSIQRDLVSLDGVRVGHDHVLGTPGQGMEIARGAMSHARLGIGAACVGGMKRCAQLVFHYATKRQAASGRLVAHPVTLGRLGRVTAGVTALECLVQQLADATDSGHAVPSEAFTVCKVAAPEMLWQAVDDLVQLLGRRGYVETRHIRNLIQDAQTLRSCEGPTEAMSALLGARLLASGEEPVSRLVRDIFGAPGVGSLVGLAINAVEARLAQQRPQRGDGPLHWLHTRAGELTMWLVLLAAVEGRLRKAPSGDLERAAAWTRANFDRTLATVQADAAMENTGDDSRIEQAVASYARSIGDVDPLSIWEEQAAPTPLSSKQAEAGTQPNPSATLIGETQDAHGAGRTATVTPDLREWIMGWLSNRLRVPATQIDPKRSFADHGLDSLATVELTKALSDHLGRALDETLLWNFATIDAVADYLTQPGTQRSTPPEPGAGTEPRGETGEAALEDEITRLERELRRR